MNEVSLTNNMDFNSGTFPSSQTLVIDSEKTFGFKTNMKIFGFNEKTKFVPELTNLIYLMKLLQKQYLLDFAIIEGL